MKNIRQRVLNRELLAGTWCGLGSSLTAEIAGMAGFDWVLLDGEHGAGDFGDLCHQLQGVGCTASAPIVRVPWNDFVRIKKVLDLGAAGVMVPWVNNAEEAKQAASAMRYPPAGNRGLARMTRAGKFGFRFDDYTRVANEELVTIVQIETLEGVNNAEEIAKVDGVDVLFVGPSDLSMDMGIAPGAQDPKFTAALEKVVAGAKNAGKAAGILLHHAAQVESIVKTGFTFIALGSDAAMVAAGMKAAREALRAK